jgi:hypothetical protein
MPDKTATIKAVKTENVIAQTERAGFPELLVVNKGLRHLKEIELFPWHLQIAIPYRDADAQGMPSPQEAPIIIEVSDAVTAFVLEGRTEHGAPNALFFAQSTWNGIRELHFRVHDEARALELLGKKTYETWARDWEFRMFEDVEWRMVAPISNLLAGDEPLR